MDRPGRENAALSVEPEELVRQALGLIRGNDISRLPVPEREKPMDPVRDDDLEGDSDGSG